jgi:flagellar hook assembly protein FlgD
VGIHNNQTIKTPSDFELFDAYPNPFNPSTTITYSLPMVSDVRIEIIDINGELITSSQSSSLATGMHEYQWNGTDASDSPAASGIYFCRLTANASDGSIFSHTVKLVLMK